MVLANFKNSSYSPRRYSSGTPCSLAMASASSFGEGSGVTSGVEDVSGSGVGLKVFFVVSTVVVGLSG